jgi:sarcosine oxidase
MSAEHPAQTKFETIVLGLGGMGSATLAHLAQRGVRALGIEQFARGHELGASAGRSRIIRKAYFEDPAYVPLLERAYELWRNLELQTSSTLLDLVGLLLVGQPHGETLAGARTSAQRYGVRIENLDARDLSARYPHLRLEPGEEGVLEREAGMVFPEAAIAAHLNVAHAHGAEMRFEMAATSIDPRADGIRLTLADGGVVFGDRLVICAGPWMAGVAADLSLPLRVQRNVQIWFEPAVPYFAADRFPAFLIERDRWASSRLYGFPDYGYGVKAAFHAFGDETTAPELDRSIRPTDVEIVREALEAFMPGAAAVFSAGKACMYTLTPDEHFIVDLHPHDSRIVLAGGFSGHGFKFASVIGEICADLATAGGTEHPVGFLALKRFDRGLATA